jgi:23S rRNA pseudoU1915 N3-methylase RlmH
VELARSVLKMEMQTTVVEQYKEIMGIDKMEEDDLIIESKKPKQKKKKKEQVKEPASLFPSWYKKKFLDSIEPRQKTRRSKELDHDLDRFTSDFFGQVDGNLIFD